MNFNQRLQHYMIKSFKFSKSNVINPVPQCWVASHWLHLLVLLFSLGIFDFLEWWWFSFMQLMWISPCSCKKCHNYFSNVLHDSYPTLWGKEFKYKICIGRQSLLNHTLGASAMKMNTKFLFSLLYALQNWRQVVQKVFYPRMFSI